MADGARSCERCGAALVAGAGFCADCGAAVLGASAPVPTAAPAGGPVGPPGGPPPGPPPGPGEPPGSARPPGTRRPSRLVLLIGALAVAAVVVVVALVVIGGGDDAAVAPSTRPPATMAAGSSAPTVAPTTVTTSPARRYVGLEREQGSFPAGVTDIGGSYLVPDYGVTWAEGPEGSMFWLERVTATSADGSVARWRVVDVVTAPSLQPGDVVVLGLDRCEVGGQPTDEVVGVFASSGQEWLVTPRAAWRVDRTAGRLVPVTSPVRCIDEGYGV